MTCPSCVKTNTDRFIIKVREEPVQPPQHRIAGDGRRVLVTARNVCVSCGAVVAESMQSDPDRAEKLVAFLRVFIQAVIEERLSRSQPVMDPLAEYVREMVEFLRKEFP